MYRCKRCGTAFVDPLPTDEELTRFYAKYHLDSEHGGSYDDVEARMQADFPAKIQAARAATHGKVGRLLDVGCGKGFFVRACVDQGIDAQGIDLSDSGVAYAVKTLGVRAACADLSQAKDSLGKFDTVTCWATVEHLPDPIRSLRDIRSILVPGGSLLLDTGIGDDWLDRLLPGRVQWYDPPQHLSVFSADGMNKALKSAGFDGIQIDRCFERSGGRRILRIVRSAVVAAGLRAVATVGRMRCGTFEQTRYPLGNLMMASGRAV